MQVIKPHTDHMTNEDVISGLDLKSDHPVISIVGGGGKTTILNGIAREWIKKNIRGVATTTTHICYPKCSCFLEDFQETVFFEALKKHHVVWMGRPETSKKIIGLSEEDQIKVFGTGVPIAAEADGAKRLPVKIPGEHEPVIFPGTNILIGVLGLDGLGKKIGDTVFRSELFAVFLNKSTEDILTESDYAMLIESDAGLQKKAENIEGLRVILNKADCPERIESAMKIKKLVSARIRDHTYITSFKEVERC